MATGQATSNPLIPLDFQTLHSNGLSHQQLAQPLPAFNLALLMSLSLLESSTLLVERRDQGRAHFWRHSWEVGF